MDHWHISITTVSGTSSAKFQELRGSVRSVLSCPNVDCTHWATLLSPNKLSQRGFFWPYRPTHGFHRVAGPSDFGLLEVLENLEMKSVDIIFWEGSL